MSVDSDGIIIHQIQILGYTSFGENENFYNLTTPQLISLLRFLFSKFPDKEPIPPPSKNSAQLYKYAAGLVDIIVKLGYPESIGYDSILYPQAEKSRSIVSYILEKIPRVESEAGKPVTVTSPMSVAIKSCMDDFAFAKKSRSRSYISQSIKPISKATSETMSSDLEKLSEEPKRGFHSVPLIIGSGISFNKQCGLFSLDSLLALNDREGTFNQFEVNPQTQKSRNLAVLANRAFQGAVVNTDVQVIPTRTNVLPSTKARSRIANAARFDFRTEDTKIGSSAASIATTATTAPVISKSIDKIEETVQSIPKLTMEQVRQIKNEQQSEINELMKMIQQLESQISGIEQGIDLTKEEIQRLMALLAALEAENLKLEAEALKLQKMAEIAKSDSSQIRNLQSDLVNTTASLLEIADQWEKQRIQLVTKYRELSSSIRRKNDDYQMMITKLNKLKRQIQDGDEKLANDQQSIEALKQVISSREEQRPRSEYIENIFKIIRTIEKQEADVENIRVDIRKQNNSMNQTIEKVKRTWSLLDETIYSEAKKSNNEWPRNTYKIVVELLMILETISENIETSGKFTAQMMEIDSKIVRVEAQIDRKALEKIESDLLDVKREIAARQ